MTSPHHRKENSNDLSRSFRLSSRLSKWEDNNHYVNERFGGGAIVVQTAVGGGGDAYANGGNKGGEKNKRKYKFYDNKAPFSQKKII